MSSLPYADREQTEVKHQILTRYLSAFVPIVGDWATDIAYIDCMAGPWQSVDKDYKDTSFGRSIEVLRSGRDVLRSRGKSPSIRCLLIEKDPSAFRELEKYSGQMKDLEITSRNWDLTKHIQDVVQFATARNNSFPFVFIDPKGWEAVQIEVIKPLLALQPGEVLVNFMSSWITRFLHDKSKRFDRLVGSDWDRLILLKGDELEDELVSSYAAAVRAAGRFKYVCTLPVMKPNQDAFHFHMIYGTRHIRGVEVFKATEKFIIPFMHETRAQAQARRDFVQSGQHNFLQPLERYRESRFTRHQLRSVATAKFELRRQLESLGELLYDDAWATVMQHSAVTDADFRELLNEWMAEGLIEITGQQAGQKLPRKHAGQFLRWIRF